MAQYGGTAKVTEYKVKRSLPRHWVEYGCYFWDSAAVRTCRHPENVVDVRQTLTFVSGVITGSKFSSTAGKHRRR